ncbi:MAG: hypothetical protein Q4G58_17770 [bacterium]|nr:hypothetical protein [bacterium]
MKKENIMWGLLLVLGAMVLIFGKLGYLGDINAVSLIVSAALGLIAVINLFKLEFTGVFFPLAFIGIIYDKELGITAITPWIILVAAALLSIGFSLIFHKHHHHYHTEYNSKENYDEKDFDVIDVEDASNVTCTTKFGASAKYVNTEDFKQADLSCSFGAMKVYFDNATIQGEKAVVRIDGSFCGIELYVPKKWQVEDHLNVSLAGVTEKNRNQSTGTPVLVLVGSISFSGVDIIYV